MPTPEPGVAFSYPPPHLLASAVEAAATAAAQLPPDAKGGIVAVGTEAGWNAAIVHRAPSGNFEVAGFIGKSWGTRITGGGAVRVVW